MKSIIHFSVVFITTLILIESKQNILVYEPKDARVIVDIFYNPYDAASISFIKNQGPNKAGVWDLMLPDANDLDINFVPWSNANTDSYTCPGEEGCLPTRIHACAIGKQELYPDGNKNHQIFHFIFCTVNNSLWTTNPSQAVVQCVNAIGEWPTWMGRYINDCGKNTTESDAYLAPLQQQADEANVHHAPWVTINGTPNQNAESDLKSAICNSFDDNKPDVCKSGEPGGAIFQTTSNILIIISIFCYLGLQ